MSGKPFDNKLSGAALTFQPLYRQVQEQLTELIVDQHWKPGEMLPNEFALAEQFEVSQGTVRKALSALTDEKILERRQGVGTFVSEHSGQQALYRFFPLVADGKKPQLPTAEILQKKRRKPSRLAAENLMLSDEEMVIFLSRRRLIDGKRCLLEDIYLPEKYFTELLSTEDIPHTLYHFYQTQFNLTVHNTTDKIKAVLAKATDAKLLGVEIGTPLLQFTRLTFSLDGKRIEFRVNRCLSDHYHYLVELR